MPRNPSILRVAAANDAPSIFLFSRYLRFVYRAEAADFLIHASNIAAAPSLFRRLQTSMSRHRQFQQLA